MRPQPRPGAAAALVRTGTGGDGYRGATAWWPRRRSRERIRVARMKNSGAAEPRRESTGLRGPRAHMRCCHCACRSVAKRPPSDRKSRTCRCRTAWSKSTRTSRSRHFAQSHGSCGDFSHEPLQDTWGADVSRIDAAPPRCSPSLFFATVEDVSRRCGPVSFAGSHVGRCITT